MDKHLLVEIQTKDFFAPCENTFRRTKKKNPTPSQYSTDTRGCHKPARKASMQQAEHLLFFPLFYMTLALAFMSHHDKIW